MNAHVYLATPTKDWAVSTAYCDSVLALAPELATIGVGLTSVRQNGGGILLARNQLVERFRASPATHLLFVDADVGFSPMSVTRMLAEEVDVVGGIYGQREHNWDAVRRADALHMDPAAVAVPLRAKLTFPITRGGKSGRLLSAAALQNGFLLISRHAIESMRAKLAPELRCIVNGGEEIVLLFDRSIRGAARVFAGEDTTFCMQWREMGGELWMDPDCELAHIGPCEYRTPTVTQIFQMREESQQKLAAEHDAAAKGH